MKTTLRRLFFFGIFITGQVFAQVNPKAPEGNVILKGEEIRTLLAKSNKMMGDAGLVPGAQPRFSDTHYTFDAKGYIFATRNGFSDSGEWQIRGDQLCILLRKWLNPERCSDVSRNAEGKLMIGSWYQEK